MHCENLQRNCSLLGICGLLSVDFYSLVTSVQQDFPLLYKKVSHQEIEILYVCLLLLVINKSIQCM